MPPPWTDLLPRPGPGDAALDRIEACLEDEAVRRDLAALERRRRYPAEPLSTLRGLGLSAFLADAPDDPFAIARPPRNTPLDVGRLMHGLARHSASLAITVSVNHLASLPVWRAGSEAQVRDQAEAIHAGESCALGLTEIATGSDLMGTATAATPTADAARFRLSGTKDLINGGRRHGLLTVLARVDAGRREHPSLFRVRRDASVSSPRRWRTAPVPAADISSVRLSGSPAELLGRRGRGFEIVSATLTLSRGAIGVFGFSTASRAAELGADYAMRRLRRGAPIVDLDPVADHLLALRAMEVVAGAMSLKALVTLNHLGPAAVLPSCAAKLLCCELGEAATTEARLLHGADALLADSPVHRLVRDAPLYGVFDGTSHVVLDQMQLRLEQRLAAGDRDVPSPIAAARAAYAEAPRSLTAIARLPVGVPQALPSRCLEALAERATGIDPTPLVDLGRAAERAASATFAANPRATGRSDRQEAARIHASIEALLATVELTDPGCRDALDMAASPASPCAGLRARYAVARFAARTCRQLADRSPDPDEVDRLRRHFAREAGRLRETLLADRHETLCDVPRDRDPSQ